MLTLAVFVRCSVLGSWRYIPDKATLRKDLEVVFEWGRSLPTAGTWTSTRVFCYGYLFGNFLLYAAGLRAHAYYLR